MEERWKGGLAYGGYAIVEAADIQEGFSFGTEGRSGNEAFGRESVGFGIPSNEQS
jgi:hypothetical protein